MTDALGHRAVFSIVLPATNAITEPDMAALRTPGVSNQTFRFPYPRRPQNLDDLIDLMGPAIALALDCQPDRIIVGFSTEFLPDGFEIASQLRAYVEGIVKRPTTMASDAVPEALKVLRAERIGIVTPYSPETNRNVRSYFTGLGFHVSNIIGIARADKGRIDTARIREAEVRTAVADVDAAEVDALVQVGTAMVCADFSADLEKQHGKPVVAVNAATYWMALRQHGISDRLHGHGMLLAEH
jgi:maleate isomerase